MALNIAQLLSVLIGAVAGAGGTGTITAYTLRWQSRQALTAEQRARDSRAEEERRARDMAATATVRENLIKLSLLEDNPDQAREKALSRRMDKGEDYDKIVSDLGPPDDPRIEEWFNKRDSLILTVETAAGDISAHELRARIDEACTLIRYYNGPEIHVRQYENQTRHIATAHALKCISAYRRGDPLPDRPRAYRNTKDDVDAYIEGFEDT
ncbi:MAG TPA: hypothetical protein VGH27_33485 [Streptosporangiaceae bacterium]